MSSPKKQKNSLWYKYLDNASVRILIEGHLPSSEEEPTVSDIKKEIVKETDLKIENFTLKIKRPADTKYEELNEDLFNSCGNNYNTLRVNFNITKENPINVEGNIILTLQKYGLVNLRSNYGGTSVLAAHFSCLSLATTSENQEMQRLRDEIAALKLTQG